MTEVNEEKIGRLRKKVPDLISMLYSTKIYLLIKFEKRGQCPCINFLIRELEIFSEDLKNLFMN
jgi:hypothetical protein